MRKPEDWGMGISSVLMIAFEVWCNVNVGLLVAS